ncbi:MAG: hypothetical protein SFU86_06790 [Pirellulaceae bacterium]|nr:hypothetical protein [Pirellulaceae bacterium]
MATHWQDGLALALCLVAAGYIAWRSWQTVVRRRAAGCGSSCGKCASAANLASEPAKLVQIDVPPRS